ncbi:MAG: hypothetical protein A2086_03305 [Spirochaetes bacterium GWD1_27_9]|nr:MAG: hypothetical protein A2Z98_12535 [Spirochaetes bacterium GWB1_27_13]OHD45276.1 MAG: hypothetical protein A2086_03305 [Spirochaetes bacterium GWD1_27_9]
MPINPFIKNLNAGIVPLLTKLAYANKLRDYVGFKLFPIITHPVSMGQIAKFREMLEYSDSRRAPGSNTKRVSLDKADFKNFFIEEFAREMGIDDSIIEEALEPIKTLKLEEQALLSTLRNLLAIEMEVKQANLATNPNNFPNKTELIGTSKFDSPDSDPQKIIDEAKECIADETGVDPLTDITMVVSGKAYRALKDHPKLKEALSSQRTKVLSKKDLIEILEVKDIVVGRAVKRVSGERTVIWGKNITLAYVPDKIESLKEPSFGVTVRKQSFPKVERYRDEPSISWMYRYRDALESLVIDGKSGYLIENAVS